MITVAAEQVQVVVPGRTYVGKQGFTYRAGASVDTVGARQVCMNVLPMPDGIRAKAHYHTGIETIAYLLEGECVVHYGDRLEQQVAVRAGEQILSRRTFRTHRPTMPTDAETAATIKAVSDEIGIQGLFSFLSPDKRKTYCLYEAPSPERSAQPPVDSESQPIRSLRSVVSVPRLLSSRPRQDERARGRRSKRL
jgi:uncharacterized RmlC-like cupin family protein